MFPAALNATGSFQQGDVSDTEAAARRSFPKNSSEIRFKKKKNLSLNITLLKSFLHS